MTALKFWEIGNNVDELRLYAVAPTKEKALEEIESLVGPLPPQRTFCRPIEHTSIPVGETIFGFVDYEEDSDDDETEE